MQAILHIDGDAFFASCEIAQNEALRGKPVVVGRIGELPLLFHIPQKLEVSAEECSCIRSESFVRM
jgi:hypothetical protein